MRKSSVCLGLAVGAILGCSSSQSGELYEETPGLSASVQVREEAARAAVLDRFPGATIEEAMLEEEAGRIVYAFEIELDGNDVDAYVDATSGLVLERATMVSPDLAARVTVPDDRARSIALDRIPGGRIFKGELEDEDGALVYNYLIVVPGTAGLREVLVDAGTGAVMGEVRKGVDAR
jgi:uncharacterized membrane protein YkoI